MLSIKNFLRKNRNRERAEKENIPISFNILENVGGEVQEIIELPIQRSIIKANGYYAYNFASDQKPLSEQDRKLLGEAKSLIASDITNSIPEGMELKEIFSPTYFEKAREVALGYLKSYLPTERAYYISYIAASDTIGFGPISLLLEDSKNIEEIEINAPTLPISVYTSKYGRCSTNLRYNNEEDFKRSINKLLYLAENEINSTNPIVDAEIGNIRVHAQIKPYAHSGGFASIRIEGRKEIGVKKVVSNGTASPELLAYIWLALDSRLNIIIAGAPASGKTTLLSSLISLIPRYNKIVIIEDETNELENSAFVNAVSIYSSKKGITQEQQVINALRMRPDRLIVGEIRGKEAREMFSGSNLGIPFMTTMHSNEGGLSILRRLSVQPMSVEASALSMLDLAIYMKQTEVSRRRIDIVYEYSWLSRGEIDGTQGIDVGNVDKVSIEEIAKNGLIDLEKLKDSKVIGRFAYKNGLSRKKAIEELKKRAEFIKSMQNLKEQEIEEEINKYGVLIG